MKKWYGLSNKFLSNSAFHLLVHGAKYKKLQKKLAYGKVGHGINETKGVGSSLFYGYPKNVLRPFRLLFQLFQLFSAGFTTGLDVFFTVFQTGHTGS